MSLHRQKSPSHADERNHGTSSGSCHQNIAQKSRSIWFGIAGRKYECQTHKHHSDIGSALLKGKHCVLSLDIGSTKQHKTNRHTELGLRNIPRSIHTTRGEARMSHQHMSKEKSRDIAIQLDRWLLGRQQTR